MTSEPLDLEALREVVDAATDLPWEVRGPYGISWSVAQKDAPRPLNGGNRLEDAALIVAAVTALPVLLDALEEARRSNQQDVIEWDELNAERDALTAEVARLTAVVQGVREQLTALADTPDDTQEWECEEGGYVERVPVVRVDRIRALASGTDKEG